VPDEIAGFPTIKLFAAGAKDAPVDYAGARTVEDLALFIKTHGKYHVDAYASNATGEEDAEMAEPDTTMAHQAPAATVTGGGGGESVKSAASVVAEVVKTVMVAGGDDGAGIESHDEL
jgi:protein disulfide-isomerase A1